VPGSLARAAMESKARVKASNVRLGMLSTDAAAVALGQPGRGNYSIYTDGPV